MQARRAGVFIDPSKIRSVFRWFPGIVGVDLLCDDGSAQALEAERDLKLS